MGAGGGGGLCAIEFTRITQSWHFCTTSNENKLELVTSGINFDTFVMMS